jgi:hypothetical protein
MPTKWGSRCYEVFFGWLVTLEPGEDDLTVRKESSVGSVAIGPPRRFKAALANE